MKNVNFNIPDKPSLPRSQLYTYMHNIYISICIYIYVYIVYIYYMLGAFET